ncbi:unnamed protein product [Dibothriocephalus latus]|uniref:Uncharacterized protein n=1 Tax=Dibothriocephalus latus TaxID=60516 RepID=A0A3P7QMR0_DIBLA|nr:unnamed protein product [Dibothriocephalus latus]
MPLADFVGQRHVPYENIRNKPKCQNELLAIEEVSDSEEEDREVDEGEEEEEEEGAVNVEEKQQVGDKGGKNLDKATELTS